MHLIILLCSPTSKIMAVSEELPIEKKEITCTVDASLYTSDIYSTCTLPKRGIQGLIPQEAKSQSHPFGSRCTYFARKDKAIKHCLLS